MISRRAFFTAIAAAPIAALAPWQPARFVGVDLAAGTSSTAVLYNWREVDKFVVEVFPSVDPWQVEAIKRLVENFRREMDHTMFNATFSSDGST